MGVDGGVVAIEPLLLCQIASVPSLLM